MKYPVLNVSEWNGVNFCCQSGNSDHAVFVRCQWKLSDAMQNSITITILYSWFFEYPEVCVSSENRVTNYHSKWRQFPHVLVFVQASCTCLLVHITEFVLCWPEVVLNPSVFISREGRGITLEPGLFGALLPHGVVALLVFRGVSRYKNLSFRLLCSWYVLCWRDIVSGQSRFEPSAAMFPTTVDPAVYFLIVLC